MLYFFLSYARGDDNEYVSRFFEDLSAEVRIKAGLPPGTTVGFLDRAIESGTHWPTRVAEALATCKSFVALLTPRYMNSEPCGREWGAFSLRAGAYDRAHNTSSRLLKPIAWTLLELDAMAPAVRSVQVRELPDGPHRRFGLRQVVRQARYRDIYLEYVDDLAGEIVEGIKRHRIPDGSTNVAYEEMPNAFASRSVAVEPRAEGRAERNPSALLVHIITVVSDLHELRRVRHDTSNYGEDSFGWKPYRPDCSEPIAGFASRVAQSHQIIHELADVRDLHQRALFASRHNQIVVLIVDAWMTRVAQTQRLLAEFNARASEDRSPITAVLVPRGRTDMETMAHWRGLSSDCQTTLYHIANDNELYWPLILSHKLFEELLPKVLEVARNRVYSKGLVKRLPPPGRRPDMPYRDGPWLREIGEEERE